MANVVIMDECVQLCDCGGVVSAKGGDEYTPARQSKEHYEGDHLTEQRFLRLD